MRHLDEEQLMMHYYGEESAAAAHLEQCAVCREEYRSLERVLETVRECGPPEPAASFEVLTWQKLAPELNGRASPWWSRVWVLGPAVAALVLIAFFAGRVSGPKPGLAQITPAQGRERILLVALGDHLQRSQMVLVELANAQPGDAPDIRRVQERARDLVGANRLYRQTAAFAGDTEFSGILDDLERVLTDVANRAAPLSSPELTEIQQRIESRGLIFKIRVIDANLQQKGSTKL